jgi:hypothetical protein
MLNNARTLDDLRIPPVNRLEALKGNRLPGNPQNKLYFSLGVLPRTGLRTLAQVRLLAV